MIHSKNNFNFFYKVAGSAYTFSYVSLGELIAWVIGWCLTLEYAISASATARSWSGALVQALGEFGLSTPFWFNNYELSIFSFSPLSATIIILCTIILLFGARESSTFNIIMTIFNISIILFVIVLGSVFIDTQNWKPFTPFGFQKVFVATGTVFFAYIGFDSVTTLAAEVKNPKRDMPIGVIGTLLIATVLYIGASLVLTGMVPLSKININAPLAAAFQTVGASWAGHIIAIGSITTLTATTLTSLMGQPRIFYQMAQDGLLFKYLLVLNSKKIPWISTIVTAVLATVLATLLNLDILTGMISIGTLWAFTVVCGGIIILRYKIPELNENDSWDEDIKFVEFGKFKKLESISRFANKYQIWLIVSWIMISFAFALFYRNELNPFIYIILLPPSLISILGLYILKPQSIPDTFVCPFVPFVPLIGIFVNIFLLSQKEISGVIYFCIWLALGIIIYFTYGFWNSKLRVIPNRLPNDLDSSKIDENQITVNDLDEIFNQPTSDGSIQ